MKVGSGPTRILNPTKNCQKYQSNPVMIVCIHIFLKIKINIYFLIFSNIAKILFILLSIFLTLSHKKHVKAVMGNEKRNKTAPPLLRFGLGSNYICRIRIWSLRIFQFRRIQMLKIWARQSCGTGSGFR